MLRNVRNQLILITALLFLVPHVTAHGALELNEFDTYAISDFEGHEDSFPWEGWEIWDIYAGDGYLSLADSHGVYFKGNFAGDGTLRPSGSQEWTLQFQFDVAGESYTRTVTHDGVDVVSNFEMLDWQIADGNVFQIHAWVPIPDWKGGAIANLVVLSAVDGAPRDVAPGGFFDPVTGTEIPFEAPPTVVFPAMGEGRIVESVTLTGAAKFLDASVMEADGSFAFTVNNPLAAQGQHFMVEVAESAWQVDGVPAAMSLDGGASTEFTLDLVAPESGSIEPVRIDLKTDIGGLQSWYAYADGNGVQLTDDDAMAQAFELDVPKTTPPPSILLVVGALLLLRRR